jgi:hypothetical protein
MRVLLLSAYAGRVTEQQYDNFFKAMDPSGHGAPPDTPYFPVFTLVL